jgi:hypothetical protein
MLRASKQWDIRCPRALVKMFPVRRGYYYKVTREQAQQIVRILSSAYKIHPPSISSKGPTQKCNGECWYLPLGMSRIHIHARGHMKTVFHEWYHHLEHATKGKYNSSDARQYAWEFADRLFDVFREQH